MINRTIHYWHTYGSFSDKKTIIMLTTKDIQIIAHVFIHNPKEVIQNIEYVGYFPKNVQKDSLKVVKNTDELENELTKDNTVWLLIHGKQKNIYPGWQSKVFKYINNPDGSIRWIYPEKTPKPYFLKFYSANSFRSYLIKLFYTVLFYLGLKNMVSSGSFTIYMQKKEFSSNHYLVNADNDFCIFTGTLGPNRKVVLFIKHKNNTFFVKIPLTKQAEANIKNEYYVLRNIHSTEHFSKPTVIYWPEANYLFLENIKPNKIKYQTGKLNKAHIKFIHNNLVNATVHNINGYEPIVNAYKLLQSTDLNQLPMAKGLATTLMQVFKSTLRERKQVLTTISHGDFTSWNSYTKNNKLYLYDWEFSHPDYPVFYDLFHFIFQQEILVNHTNFKTIKKKIINTIAQPEFVKYIQKNSINYQEYLKYYLLINVSYYLNLYSKQKDLHEQVYWLINVWTEAAEYIKNMEYKGGFKAFVIHKLGQFLQNKNYALIKSIIKPESLIDNTSDLDLITDRKTGREIYNFVKSENSIYKVQIIRQINMNTLELYFDDQNFLRIDLIFEVTRKNIVILNAKKALEASYLADNGWKYLPDSFGVQYIKGFFYLNNNNIPGKYIAYYKESFPEIKTSNKDKYKKYILKLSENNLFRLTWNSIKYFFGLLLLLSRPKGFVITYSGVDGSGKSTILELFAHKLKTKYRKEVVILRHRPSLLPILSAWVLGKKTAEQQAASRLPHQGTNTSTIGSILRFSYYLFDYLIGQYYVYFKYLSRGYVVLYDRYYFDFINDSKRSNIIKNKKLSRFFYHFIIKPEFNFFLYAQPEQILKRKQELSVETINELTTGYRKLFAHYGHKYKHSKYISIENEEIDKTIKFIEQALIFNN